MEPIPDSTSILDPRKSLLHEPHTHLQTPVNHIHLSSRRNTTHHIPLHQVFVIISRIGRRGWWRIIPTRFALLGHLTAARLAHTCLERALAIAVARCRPNRARLEAEAGSIR